MNPQFKKKFMPDKTRSVLQPLSTQPLRLFVPRTNRIHSDHLPFGESKKAEQVIFTFEPS